MTFAVISEEKYLIPAAATIDAELEAQRIRLQACFPEHIAWISATSKPFEGIAFHALVFKQSNAVHFYEESKSSVTDSVDRLLSKTGVTTVEQYIRLKAYNEKGGAK